MNLSDKVIKAAQAYLGKQEKTGNAGFKDPVFEQKMRAVGFQTGHSWCAYFTELVWMEALAGIDHVKYRSLSKLFSPSAVATFANFKASGLFLTGTTPKPGAVAIWRYGTGWSGHAGIVETVAPGSFTSIEGNTNDEGSREGYEVARRKRSSVISKKPAGLNLVGFIYLPE